MDQTAKAHAFKALHERDELFVIPNPWDGGSAKMLASLGFEALSRIPSFTGGLDYYMSMVGMEFHYASISRGLIDSRDVIYFLSVIVLFIALTRISLARRAT